MKSLATALTAIALLTAASLSMAAPHSSKASKTPAPATVKGVIHCPVLGTVIRSPKDAFNSEVYKGKTYYFCCAGCKPMFDKDPAKYAKDMTKTAEHPSSSM